MGTTVVDRDHREHLSGMEEARREGAGIKYQGEKRHPRFQNDDEDDNEGEEDSRFIRKSRGAYLAQLHV